MKRRSFIVGLGSTAAWPLAARGQADGTKRVLGVQLGTSRDDVGQGDLVQAFISELGRLGWSEGSHLQIEYRWAAGDLQRVKEQAADLVRIGPDVIFGQGTPVTTQLKSATRTIPVVFVNVADPVGSGLVDSFARPGANVTGFTNYEESLAGKWLQILKETAPQLARVVMIVNPDNPSSTRFTQVIETVARTLGVAPVTGPARTQADVQLLLDAFQPTPADGLIVMPDFLLTTHRELIIERANRARMPSIFPFRLFALGGGLAAYSIDEKDAFRRAAAYVDRILRGTAPADLPVQAPTRFELTVNLKTARQIGIDVPPSLLAQADEVIE